MRDDTKSDDNLRGDTTAQDDAQHPVEPGAKGGKARSNRKGDDGAEQYGGGGVHGGTRGGAKGSDLEAAPAKDSGGQTADQAPESKKRTP